VHADNLPKHLVVLLPSRLLHLPSTRLLRLTQAPLSVRQQREGVHAPLLLQANQLLAEEVQRLANVARLHLGNCRGPQRRARASL